MVYMKYLKIVTKWWCSYFSSLDTSIVLLVQVSVTKLDSISGREGVGLLAISLTVMAAAI